MKKTLLVVVMMFMGNVMAQAFHAPRYVIKPDVKKKISGIMLEDIIINYDCSIKKLSKVYGKVDGWVTEGNFPSVEKGKKKVEFRLFATEKSVETDEEVFAKINTAGYRLASMKELMFWFGKKYQY